MLRRIQNIISVRLKVGKQRQTMKSTDYLIEVICQKTSALACVNPPSYCKLLAAKFSHREMHVEFAYNSPVEREWTEWY